MIDTQVERLYKLTELPVNHNREVVTVFDPVEEDQASLPNLLEEEINNHTTEMYFMDFSKTPPERIKLVKQPDIGNQTFKIKLEKEYFVGHDPYKEEK